MGDVQLALMNWLRTTKLTDLFSLSLSSFLSLSLSLFDSISFCHSLCFSRYINIYQYIFLAL
uniref:Uncharacterized protein n=1 Tax=Anguilla anguilla TaxID=7936 RepID=A0A0E9WL09_ANGAN